MDALTYERLLAARDAENARLAEELQDARATIARLERRVAELEAAVAAAADDEADDRPVRKHWSADPPTA